MPDDLRSFPGRASSRSMATSTRRGRPVASGSVRATFAKLGLTGRTRRVVVLQKWTGRPTPAQGGRRRGAHGRPIGETQPLQRLR
jgi:hypothetical protein